MASSMVPSDLIDSIVRDEKGAHMEVDPLISAESLSVVPFVDVIVAVNVQADPGVFAWMLAVVRRPSPAAIEAEVMMGFGVKSVQSPAVTAPVITIP